MYTSREKKMEKITIKQLDMAIDRLEKTTGKKFSYSSQLGGVRLCDECGSHEFSLRMSKRDLSTQIHTALNIIEYMNS